MSDTAPPSEVRSVLLPLQQGRLLLPNAAVCEVVGYRDPDRGPEDAPAWWLGQFAWRQHSVPMISFERLMGQGVAAPGHRARLAICNTLSGSDLTPYVGIVLDSAPHLVRVTEDTLSPVEAAEDLVDCVLNQVLVNHEPALIPDLDAIERQLTEYQGLRV
jgi:chemosensory pili system protein ChpC